MSPIKRRQFLQFASSALATIGLSQLDIIRQGDRYGKILAQDTPRKLALLVGINDYPQSDRFRNLYGCLNDVELQRQLLIHRFGFNENDILTLTNTQASRQGILDSFNEHLVKQAKPGDVVIFHFSGHGSEVVDPNPIDPTYKLNSTFVPADDYPLSQPGIVNDITGHTLFLLMYALKQKTENVTVLLDSCHSGGGTRGNVRVRAVRGGEEFKTSPNEWEEQEKWLKQLKLSRTNFIEEYQKGIATGVVIASAQRHQFAADYEFPGFSAGAFTYLLTQYLWQRSSDVENAIALINRNLSSLPVTHQNPLAEVKLNSGNERKPLYFLKRQLPPAEAVVIEAKGNEATLWLGGIDPDSFDAFNEGAAFTSIGNNPRGLSQVKLTARQGLIGNATVEGTVQSGQILQEFARAIPSDWQMQVGLDFSLGADTTAAETALQALHRIEPILFQAWDKPYPQPVHYILSRMTPTYRQKLQQDKATEIPPEDSIGLFSQTLELIPRSFAKPGETIENAIARLKPKLKALLAARIIKLTLNAQSSKLNLGVTLQLEQGNQFIAEAFTVRGCQNNEDNCQPRGRRGSGQLLTQTLPLAEPFQFEITNQEDNPLYLGILAIDPAGKINVLFPNEFQRESDEELDKATRVEAKQTLLVPNPQNDDFVLITDELGKGEMLILASQKPLTKALLRLRSLRGSRRGPFELEEPVDVIGDLLNDLSRSARAIVRSQFVSPSEMAALSITYEGVE